jgi:hypothetical protein
MRVLTRPAKRCSLVLRPMTILRCSSIVLTQTPHMYLCSKGVTAKAPVVTHYGDKQAVR